jgi:hypothetical protein
MTRRARPPSKGAQPTPTRRPATCHPSKPTFRRGLCSPCYFRARRAKATAILDPARPVQSLLEAAAREPPRDLAHAVALAQDELIAALPEAARALRRVLVDGDPDKGFSVKAAVAVLRGMSIPGGPAGLRRLLEAPLTKPAPAAPAQVVIGLHVSSGDVQVGRVVGTIGAAPGER